MNWRCLIGRHSFEMLRTLTMLGEVRCRRCQKRWLYSREQGSLIGWPKGWRCLLCADGGAAVSDYLAKRPTVRVVCTTRSAGKAWKIARKWGEQPGWWLASRTMRDHEDGPYVDEGPPNGVQVEQSRERVLLGYSDGAPVWLDDAFVYRVVVDATNLNGATA